MGDAQKREGFADDQAWIAHHQHLAKLRQAERRKQATDKKPKREYSNRPGALASRKDLSPRVRRAWGQIASARYRAEQIAKDPEGYYARRRESKRQYYLRNAERVKALNRASYRRCSEMRRWEKKRYRETNRERLAAYSRQHYQANLELKREYNKQYRQTNCERESERHRQYRQANHERILERQRQYRQVHHEHILDSKKQCYQASRERMASDPAYAEKIRNQQREADARRYAKKRAEREASKQQTVARIQYSPINPSNTKTI